jgi:hypothetical protein
VHVLVGEVELDQECVDDFSLLGIGLPTYLHCGLEGIHTKMSYLRMEGLDFVFLLGFFFLYLELHLRIGVGRFHYRIHTIQGLLVEDKDLIYICITVPYIWVLGNFSSKELV